MKTMVHTNFLISAGSNYDDLEKDGKIKAFETIFVKDRLAGKTKDASMYFFEKTTYLKEKELHNRNNYFNLAKNIAKETID